MENAVQRPLCCPCGRAEILALGLCPTCYTLKRQDGLGSNGTDMGIFRYRYLGGTEQKMRLRIRLETSSAAGLLRKNVIRRLAENR